MTKFEQFDIESIKDCIKKACNREIEIELSEDGYRDDYKIRRDNIEEAERLIALMDTLKQEENV